MHRPVVHERTRVGSADCNGHGATAELDGAKLVGFLGAHVVMMAESELASIIPPPATNTAAAEQGAGMRKAGSDSEHSWLDAFGFTPVAGREVAVVAFLSDLDLSVAATWSLTSALAAPAAAKETGCGHAVRSALL